MTSITQNQRYIPHELNTKYYATKLYRNGYPISFVCRRYKISKSSLMRWNRKFDGTKESLMDKSHKPLTPHPNSHTELEIKWIKMIILHLPYFCARIRKRYGASEYKILSEIPEFLKNTLPSIEDIEKRLEKNSELY